MPAYGMHFEVGQKVFYHRSSGDWVQAEVVKIHHGKVCELEYFGLATGNRRRRRHALIKTQELLQQQWHQLPAFPEPRPPVMHCRTPSMPKADQAMRHGATRVQWRHDRQKAVALQVASFEKAVHFADPLTSEFDGVPLAPLETELPEESEMDPEEAEMDPEATVVLTDDVDHDNAFSTVQSELEALLTDLKELEADLESKVRTYDHRLSDFEDAEMTNVFDAEILAGLRDYESPLLSTLSPPPPPPPFPPREAGRLPKSVVQAASWAGTAARSLARTVQQHVFSRESRSPPAPPPEPPTSF